MNIKKSSMLLFFFMLLFIIYGLDKQVSEMDTNYRKIGYPGEKDFSKTKVLLDDIYDLNKKGVSDFLLERLNFKDVFIDGKENGVRLLKITTYIYPEKGLNWVLNNYHRLNEYGKVNIAKSLYLLDNYYESYQIYIILLNDNTYCPIYGEPSPGLAPNIEVVSYEAYHCLRYCLDKNKIKYPHMRTLPAVFLPEKYTIENFKMLTDWWDKDSPVVMKDFKRAFADQEEFQKKCEKLKEYILSHPAKKYKMEVCPEQKDLQEYVIQEAEKIEKMTDAEYEAFLKSRRK